MSPQRHLGYRHLILCCLAWCLTATHGYAEYEMIDVSDGGTIKGQAVWKGSIPKLPPLKVLADLDTCGTQVPSPALRVDPATNGLQDVLVVPGQHGEQEFRRVGVHGRSPALQGR